MLRRISAQVIDPDVETIPTALRILRNTAHNHRHGGLGNYFAAATDGLEALARIEARLKPSQPALFNNGDRENAERT
ncbi:MAG: hypothetical protein H8D74_00555 [Chloroflexi bacterium]|nr:hypothetical protein [Chloroflexota bacterium]